MAAGKDKLGEAYVEIRADDSKLSGDMDKAEQVVEQKTEQMGENIDENVAEKIQGASSKVTGFIGAFTAMVGVGFLMERLGEKISKIALSFIRAKDNALEFQRSLRDAKSTEELQKQLNDLNDSVTSGAANIANAYHAATDFFGLTEETSRGAKRALIEEEIAARRVNEVKKRAAELEKKRLALVKEITDAEKARYDKIKAENEQLEIDALSGIDKIERERERKRREVQKRIEEETNESNKRILKKQLDLIDKSFDKQIEAVRKIDDATRELDAQRIADKERQEIESIQRQADALERAMTNALKTIAGKQTTGGNLAVPIKEVGRRIEAKIDSLKFGG